MTKVQPITKSIIAEYLTKNKAISKRDGNICRFYSPEGLYLGNQVKGQLNDFVDTYTTTIYGDSLRPMYQKRTLLGRSFARVTGQKKNLSVVLVDARKSDIFIDYLGKKYNAIFTEIKLRNNLNLIGLDERTGAGFFELDNTPIKYDKVQEREDFEAVKVKFSNYRVYSN